MLRREGADLAVSEKFYCAVMQVFLLFGEDMCVLLATMAQRLEGVHVGFLIQVIKLKGKRLRDGS